ncbi:MAG: glycoside hydrolase, partial [Anaerolineae bacterium]|nr:glycoside hydrolase [Anaerolineae bacterium]
MPIQLRIIEKGILSRGIPGTERAMLINPNVTILTDGTLLATARAGSSKDAADEMVEVYRSTDGGRTWSDPERPFPPVFVNGQPSSLRVAYLSETSPGHLLAASMWIDRGTYAGKPFFDPQTEGCLPMGIYTAESHDGAHTWSPWQQVPMPTFIGPPSLTDRLIQLPDGTLVLSIETNKNYEDSSQWFQRVVFFHSQDGGHTWGKPVTVGFDPT